MKTFLTTAALVLFAPLAACASSPPSGYANAGAAYGAVASPPVHNDDGLLSEPPANAHAGQCFAKVVVPGQPVYGPPSGPHLRWVQKPPQPGTIGPVWCQIWEAGYQPTVTMTPERYGWIRVICDKDATREKIGHLQHRLHDWGYYQGGYEGRYDAATAAAVVGFQGARHIEHGGYLSYRTMEALEVAPPAPAAPAPIYIARPPVFAPPVYAPQPTYAYAPPQPCGQCQAPPPCGPAPCQRNYGAGYQAQGGRKFLTWAGKGGY